MFLFQRATRHPTGGIVTLTAAQALGPRVRAVVAVAAAASLAPSSHLGETGPVEAVGVEVVVVAAVAH